MKHIISLIIIGVAVICTACGVQADPLPSYKEIEQRIHNPTPKQVENYCEKKGGHYEDWKNKDGSSTTYCIFPQGYGCEPQKFYDGSCSLETF